MSYFEPCYLQPCMYCKHNEYDSWHDETWCGHKPPPEGLPERLQNDKWGSCEHYEEKK